MSETKTSKIQEVGTINRWDGPNGTVFYHTILMENGDRGSIGKKHENAVKIGDTLTYQIELSDRGNKIKEVRENNFTSGGQRFAGAQRGSCASFALSYAKDIAVANINKSDKPFDMEMIAGKVVASAAIFRKWLKENE